jgi:hypothetical protein
MIPGMARMVKVPVASNNDTSPISIVCMVAHRAHLFGLTSTEKVLAVHDTLHWHPPNVATFVLV